MKRKALKKVLLTRIILYVAIIIVIITGINIKLQSDKIKELTTSLLSKESVSYAGEVYNWWSSIEERVSQIANVYKSTPELSHEDALAMLLELTKKDPDSQDIYIGYGDDSTFLDGSGWIPDDTFVFTDRGWFIGAINKNGEIFTSEPYVDASTGKTCLACAVMLRDQVVLSSDINFDKVQERLNNFKSSSDEAKFYIINKDTKDILVSNVADVVGQTVSDSSDAIMQGLNTVFDSMNTENSISADKVVIANTSVGKMMYAATDITDTSWVVVSAVPYSFLAGSIMKTVFITFAVAAVLLLVLGVVLYILINKFINPVTKVTDRITDISKGDFTVEIVPEGNNEITTLSESLRGYISNMRGMLVNLSSISKDMNDSASECFGISQTLSSANKTQGESIERLNRVLSNMNSSIDEVAKTAEDMAQTSKELTRSADGVRNLCEETMDSSSAGKGEMESMTKNVDTLSHNISDLTDIIRATSQSMQEITGITDTINAIAEQTNLLSLNASIEAARAGEMGKGFAIVASEVGVLANQSTEATETIRRLIEEVTRNIALISKKADICIKDMEECMTSMDSANRSFDLIYDDITKATDGIKQIAGGIERINDAATTNAEATREQTSTVSEILDLSDVIVQESKKLVSETDNISNISGNLNQYADAINSDLSQYVL